MIGDRIILFWSKFNKDIDTDFWKWKEREISLSPSHFLSLESHLKFGHDVHLYTYQKIRDELPGNVKVHDATKMYSVAFAWSALLRGHSIAHISDLVRLYASTLEGGLVLDMDAIIINELPDLDGFFCTMPAKATGGVAPQWGKSHPPFTIHDNSWDGKALSAFPVKVNKEMAPQIRKLAAKIWTTLGNSPKKDSKAWNYVLWTLKEMSREFKNSKVFQPIKTCPLPAWLSAGNCYSMESPTRLDGTNQMYGYTLPSIEQILNESFMVQHFFESTFQGAEQKQNKKMFWENVPDDCLIGKVARKTLGDNWKKCLQ